ncbi:putative phosphodiesterase [Ereboglobus sp. PH5-10]|uniref:metallophosphoesterase n=1 Tax=Ereboglobus sp. PH5-10 TaxID=2940629 RepID=UPI002405C09B|nr:metallophosphoesterase [Ereboglobus sp. PH5-10]MDF9827146.1 putative phosphodiesterase [Ereboglobus sp. PH5-10]
MKRLTSLLIALLVTFSLQPFSLSAFSSNYRSPAPAGAWTLAVLPDTQGYTDGFPDVFTCQTRWIAANRDARNIKFVLQAGDITNRNTHPQWLAARHSMDVLFKAKVPFVLVPGNHDIGVWGSSKKVPNYKRDTLMNGYFLSADYKYSVKRGYFEPHHMENTYQTFNTPWGDFLVLALEFFPRNAVIDWANTIVEKFPDHKVILLTHAYLYHDDSRYDRATDKAVKRVAPVTGYETNKHPDGSNDGEDMWKKLVSKHPNFLFVISGHVLGDGTGYLVSKGEHGNDVHQMMVNYQPGIVPDRGYGGAGFLRLLEFQPDGKTIKVASYSPFFDQWLEDADQQYTITLRESIAVK